MAKKLGSTLLIIVTVASVICILAKAMNPKLDAYLISMQKIEYVDEDGKYPGIDNIIQLEFLFEVENNSRNDIWGYAIYSDEFERLALDVDNEGNDFPHLIHRGNTAIYRIVYLLVDNEETRRANLDSFFVFCRKLMGDPTIVEKYRSFRWLFGLLGVGYSRILNLVTFP